MKKTEEDHSSIVLPRAGLITVMLTLIAVVSLLILRQMPAVDVAISAFFYSAGACNAPDTVEDCNEFLASVSPFWLNLREIGYYLPQILMLSLFLWQLWQLFFRRNKVMRDFILPIVGIYSAALGPGLITNEILKDNWGRPRPLTTVDFGGKFPYVLPGDMASYCDVNCSFVSGEATAAFWMLVFVFYLTGKARWRAAAGIFLLAVAISVLRIAFGRHYFSDVVMAMFVAFWSIAFVFWVVQTSPVSRFICWILDWSNRCADVLRKSR